jgi:hypothetical protein
MFEGPPFYPEPCPQCGIYRNDVLDKNDDVAMGCSDRDSCLIELKEKKE